MVFTPKETRERQNDIIHDSTRIALCATAVTICELVQGTQGRRGSDKPCRVRSNHQLANLMEKKKKFKTVGMGSSYPPKRGMTVTRGSGDSH